MGNISVILLVVISRLPEKIITGLPSPDHSGADENHREALLMYFILITVIYSYTALRRQIE